MRSSYTKVSRDGMKGWGPVGVLELLPDCFWKDPQQAVEDSGGKVIRDSKLRWAAIFSLPNQQRVFIKRDRTKGWFERLKYLILPSKARKEWFVARQLRNRKLNIPKPLGWMERVEKGFVKESYYLSEAIGSGVSLIEDAKNLGNRFPLLELARTVKRMHQEGLIHSDLHAGNFLWDGETLFLTDLHSATIVKNPTLKQKLWNLSLLFHSLRSVWEETDRTRFMDLYFEEEPFYRERKNELLKKITFLMEKLQKRHWRSRTKRCLKESTEFSVQRKNGIRFYRRRDFPLQQMKEIIERHVQVVSKNPSMLTKCSPEVTISILEDEGKKVCVKNYCPPTSWDRFKEHFRRSKGLKAWLAANGMRVRGIPSLKPLGLMEIRDCWGLQQSSFVMEALEGGEEVDRYILRNLQDFGKRRDFVKRFAQWLSGCHQIGLFHKDMKTCNIMVSEERGTWEFRFLDLEDVQLDKKVNERRLFKNFLQLNTSTPKTISTTDRVRFFSEYTRLNAIVSDRKRFLRRLIDESRKRELVYVAPWGTVRETFWG